MVEFKDGDIVTIDYNATLGDLINDHWQGCQLDTLEFLKAYGNKGRNAEIEISEYSGLLKIDGWVVNPKVLKLVRRPKIKLTEDEVSKLLGYPVEVIK